MPDDARLYTRTAVYRKIMKIAHGEMRKGPYARLAFMQHYNNCNSIVTAVDKGESQSAFRIVSPFGLAVVCAVRAQPARPSLRLNFRELIYRKAPFF